VRYVDPLYWLDGYAEDEVVSNIILLGGYNPWRPHPAPVVLQLKQVKPVQPKSKPKPIQRDPVRHQPIPGVRASLAYSVDRGAAATVLKPPQPVAASLLRRK
jgi:hypothetical protein